MPLGKIYVLSDLHGRYYEYLQLLKKIQFHSKDQMYIVGDVLDRGPNPITLLRDVMQRPNVELLLGNHELHALLMLELFIDNSISTMKNDEIPDSTNMLVQEWSRHGADTTIREFQVLSSEKQRACVAYLKKCAYTKRVQIENRHYMLVHTSMPVLYDITKTDYRENLTQLERIHSDEPLVTGATLISGHTQTYRIQPESQGKILQQTNNIFLDCGPTHLGCLCLDDLSTTYVPVNER